MAMPKYEKILGQIEARQEEQAHQLGGIQEEIKILSQTLAVNTEQLKVHIEGVKLAREQNEILRKEVDTKFEPIQQHVTRVNFLGKLSILLIGIPACLYYVLQIIRFIKG